MLQFCCAFCDIYCLECRSFYNNHSMHVGSVVLYDIALVLWDKNINLSMNCALSHFLDLRLLSDCCFLPAIYLCPINLLVYHSPIVGQTYTFFLYFTSLSGRRISDLIWSHPCDCVREKMSYWRPASCTSFEQFGDHTMSMSCGLERSVQVAASALSSSAVTNSIGLYFLFSFHNQRKRMSELLSAT